MPEAWKGWEWMKNESFTGIVGRHRSCWFNRKKHAADTRKASVVKDSSSGVCEVLMFRYTDSL